jgi:thymidylate synthase (FAD)
MKADLISKTVGVGEYENLTPGELIAAIARHGTIKADNGKLVKYLMDHKHWSPLQHLSFGFKITTSRAISAQIFRHRSLNGQEWSLRYSEPLGFEFIELRKEHPTNRQSSTQVFDPLIDASAVGRKGMRLPASLVISELFKNIDTVYSSLLEAGVAKECARGILPLATTTIIHITAPLRDLLAFLNVRCEEHTQQETRDIATAIGEALEKELPDVFEKIDWRNGLFM